MTGVISLFQEILIRSGWYLGKMCIKLFKEGESNTLSSSFFNKKNYLL